MTSLGPTDHEPSALLSDDTLSALDLREQPFVRPEKTSDMFSDEVTTDQLADIKQALITGDDLLLILGEAGIGKSTLLAQLGDNSGLRIQCFSVEGSARFSAVNLFGGMLEAFKREPPDNLKAMLDELIPCLQGMISNNTLSTIVIDNADAVDAVEMTRLLSAMLYMNSQDETLMRIALSATPEFEARIPELLPEGADLPYSTLTIEPLEPGRAADYLAWRFERVGDASGTPFDEQQIVDMNTRADGNPRRLHEVVADELNSLHGELEPAIPPELLASSNGESSSLAASLLGARSPKILLAGLGVLLIALGLMLFVPGGNDQEDRYAVVEQRKLDEENANRLALVDEETPTDESSTPEAADLDSTSDEASPDDASSDGSNPSESASVESADPESAAAESKAPEVAGAESTASDSGTPEDSGAAESSTDSVDEESDRLDEPTSDADSEGEGEGEGTDSNPSNQTAQESSAADVEPVTIAEGVSEGVESIENLATNNANGDDNSSTASNQGQEPGSSSTGTETAAGSDDPEPESEDESADSATADANQSEPSESEPAPSPESGELIDALDVPETGTQAELTEEAEPVREKPPSAEQSPVSDPSAPAADGGMESPNWILTQNPDVYTIQMIASTSRREVEVFLTDANLKGPNSIFTFQRGGVDWFALVHGLFESVEEARSAIIRMPDAALSFQPWIRSVGRVQNSLRK